MFAYAILMILGPARAGEIAWNSSGTWGVYEVDENDSNTSEGVYDSVSLWVVSKDFKTRKRLLTGRHKDQRETQLIGDLYVYPVIERWAPTGEPDVDFSAFKEHTW